MCDETENLGVESLQNVGGCGPLLARAGEEARPLRRQVFEHVRSAGQATRAEVTRVLGISPGSVTALTAELIAANMLREVEGPMRDGNRGRPPFALEVVPEGRRVIGIKI